MTNRSQNSWTLDRGSKPERPKFEPVVPIAEPQLSIGCVA